AEISRRLSVPVIGIGAGSGCDGQVLVINDMLGMQSGFTPKFVKRFLNLDGLMREAVQAYRKEVTAATFPAAEQSFAMKPEEHKKFAAGTDATSEVV
ncbi:3-methyl-2-oxobutanoate hydroxymethyltransferase, partial [bacterium]|nr:3-methyl-2-oxobutanoate hydroxymethyltransferase [bacterium]